MKIKIKKLHPDAIIPTYATPGAACFDLHACMVNNVCNKTLEHLSKVELVSNHDFKIQELKYLNLDEAPKIFRTGLSFEIPTGYVMLVFSRSGAGFNHDVRLSNCTGVIDSDYRGEVKIKLVQDQSTRTFSVKNGDRIAQAMIIPFNQVGFEVTEKLSETERGQGGFGSTGE